ncbi:LAFE_0B10836g1_1 [Lachancea fermentati]|uniref:LAFE_0B10836g1_1 n=1 Tax=Lachancea fermentati TaxID=4955 RepID=A0A1G4M8I5_LACFM|nr:LAFE_0B10836g1_1 [Lachancea fermentati]
MTGFKLQTIDLNHISNENQLLPIVKSILIDNDTFLLKNYANLHSIHELLEQIATESPDTTQGFDANFTGALTLEHGTMVEQYITNTGELRFPRKCPNAALDKVSSRLLKIGVYFARLCLASVADSSLVITEKQVATRLTRYHKPVSNTLLDMQFEYDDEFIARQPSGIISIFPCAQNISYEYNGQWRKVDEPDCILVHTGKLLSQLSGGLHSSNRIKFSSTNSIHLDVFPVLDSTFNNVTLAQFVLDDQIQEFPQVAQKYYPRELAQQKLRKRVDFLKSIFNVTDSVISLYAISGSISTSAPELHALLPQISNMLKRKVSQESFLRMMSLWEDAYIIEISSSGELAIRTPNSSLLKSLSNKSRKLEYVQRAETWFSETIQREVIPEDVPLYRINKRRGSEGTYEAHSSSSRTNNRPISQPGRRKGYIFNTKEKFMTKEMSINNGEPSLLDRIREKERKASALLAQRERQYQDFLNVKISQVFDILLSLPSEQPYTITHLQNLIVDSLLDSNNPIGETETQQILFKLQYILSDRMKIIDVEGGLKVFRWSPLDKRLLEDRMSGNNNVI